ncbi:MAG: cytochrome-c oxidase, cbb3-type subunit II [Granulosicoccus sp.]
MIFGTHYKLEKNSLALVFAIVLVSGIGGFVEIAPLFTIDDTVEADPDMRVYTPLELAGRNIYMREGCYACHSQMIRTLRDEVDRYGPFSLAAESQYDHPMLWGSKRTGPDLARIGDKYSDQWHTQHLNNPRDVVPESIMPAYGWLLRNTLKADDFSAHLKAMSQVGVPYTRDMITHATSDAIAQATPDAETRDALLSRYGDDTNVRVFDGLQNRVTEMDAIVAYLQILGQLTQLPYQDAGSTQTAQKVNHNGT